jgi:hypothetical protein
MLREVRRLGFAFVVTAGLAAWIGCSGDEDGVALLSEGALLSAPETGARSGAGSADGMDKVIRTRTLVGEQNDATAEHPAGRTGTEEETGMMAGGAGHEQDGQGQAAHDMEGVDIAAGHMPKGHMPHMMEGMAPQEDMPGQPDGGVPPPREPLDEPDEHAEHHPNE